MKGQIKTLLNIRKKEFESKKGESDISNVLSNEEEKKNESVNKKESNEKNNEEKGIDGHWFLVNSYENIDFLSLIKYKEKIIVQTEEKTISNTLMTNTNNTSNISNVSNININQQIIKDKYSNPHIFSYIIKVLGRSAWNSNNNKRELRDCLCWML